MRRGRPTPAADLDRRQRVGRRDDRPERERRRPRQPVDQRVRDDRDRAGRRDHEPDRQQRDRAGCRSGGRAGSRRRPPSTAAAAGRSTSTSSGSSSTSGIPGTKPITRPPSTSTIGYGTPIERAAAAEHRDGDEQGDQDQLDAVHLRPPRSGSPRRSRARPPGRARAAGRRGPSTSLSVRNACVTATLPHSDCAISCAVSGCSASSPWILRARRSCIAKRSSISAAWSPNGSPWPGSTCSMSISRVSRSEAR